MSEPILVLNCGSSSIKFALFDAAVPPLARKALWSGQVDGIGKDKPYSAALQRARARSAGRSRRAGGRPRRWRTAWCMAAPSTRRRCASTPRCWRISRATFRSRRCISPSRSRRSRCCSPSCRSCRRSRASTPRSIARLPQVEQMLPLPHALWERGVRRYGFHGLSYEYMAVALAERHGDAARGRTIVAHLGSGASLCAMRELRSVATTMGFSALDGLMMGTRCGSLDPGVLLYLLRGGKAGRERARASALPRVRLARRLGPVGEPEGAARSRAHANPRARAALELYVRRIVREIGALTAVLGGLDMLAFTAGVGEHSAVLRERICARARLARACELDDEANRANARRSRAREAACAWRWSRPTRNGSRRPTPCACCPPRCPMSLNPESKYPSRRAYVVKMRSDAKPGELAGRVENLVTGAAGNSHRGQRAARLHCERPARRTPRASHERSTKDPVYRCVVDRGPRGARPRDRQAGDAVPGEHPRARRDSTRAAKGRFGVRNGRMPSLSPSCTTCSCCTSRYARKSADSFGQAQTAAIENYIIERLRKAFPDLPGGWPPA